MNCLVCESEIKNVHCKKCYKREWSKTHKYKLNKAQGKARRRKGNVIINRILQRARRRSKLSNLEFNLEKSDIFVPEFCPILGIKLGISEGHSRDASPSLDRINNNLGYIKSNVRVISTKANKMKGDATLEEIEVFCKNILPYMRGEL
jgi:hypothetical protein